MIIVFPTVGTLFVWSKGWRRCNLKKYNELEVFAGFTLSERYSAIVVILYHRLSWVKKNQKWGNQKKQIVIFENKKKIKILRVPQIGEKNCKKQTITLSVLNFLNLGGLSLYKVGVSVFRI